MNTDADRAHATLTISSRLNQVPLRPAPKPQEESPPIHADLQVSGLESPVPALKPETRARIDPLASPACAFAGPNLPIRPSNLKFGGGGGLKWTQKAGWQEPTTPARADPIQAATRGQDSRSVDKAPSGSGRGAGGRDHLHEVS